MIKPIKYIYVLILFIMLSVFGCKENQAQDFVFKKFKSKIEARGMKIDSVDKDGFIYISQGELTLKVSLDNARRNYERDKDETQIDDLVQSLVSSTAELPAKWAGAKDNVYISLFPNDYDFKDFLHIKITEEFSKVYIYSAQDNLSWISKADIAEWKITQAQLSVQANINADKLLKQTTIAFDTIENRKLGRIEVEHQTLKGALLFAPGMKEKVKAVFGFPFYAVIPVRDFCYIFSEKDYAFFSERVGKVVVDEYKGSGHPITTELLKFTDKGVEVVGKYPVK